ASPPDRSPLARHGAADDLAGLPARQRPSRRTARRRPPRVRARPRRVRDPGHALRGSRPPGPDVRARRRGAPVPLPADPHRHPDGERRPRRPRQLPHRPPRGLGAPDRRGLPAAGGRRPEPRRGGPPPLRGGHDGGGLRRRRPRLHRRADHHRGL
ncbi:MAG: Transcriptional regulator, MarR family, partial [uncultured Friedmanniella sp.]